MLSQSINTRISMRRLAVLTQYQRVTDRQTDGQTHGCQKNERASYTPSVCAMHNIVRKKALPTHIYD